ncbi:PTPLA-domain-containing protein [Leucogyrophana mollusca]|uniref:PTPLA-domain-containing protein n=1 Tax=Leucogyrophana mollusca TaxID=85980 RepID=A0ACB8B908_9AGAM|nr:PTPLA-domain-containing protein [Leucogyrophana mollusca]
MSNNATPKTRSREQSSLARFYLIAFNGVSGIGWTYVLFLSLYTLYDPSATGKYNPLGSIISYFNSTSKSTNQVSLALVSLLRPYIPSTHAFTYFALAPVQSLAILEIIHVIVGLVRSPLPTTLMQVSSRLFITWGIVARFSVTRTNPIYTTMVLSWAITEVPRYMFYVVSLMGSEPPMGLTWLRYTSFYVLYPLGAGSEAMLMLSTIPEWANGGWARWGLEDFAHAGLWVIWWPALYVMYTHMMRQRRRVLGVGKGQKLGGKPKDRVKAE